MATRAEARDYADVAAALASYDRGQLIELARRADPDLADGEITEAMQLLDEMDDAVFAQNQFSPHQVRGIREAFASWPRSAEAQADRREPEAGA
jgi:hypothetical protein